MANVLDELLDRGYIKQFTHEEETRKLLENEKVTFYIGFDPTADSLHVGHFIAMMFMAHMQRAGHRPIALLGGGTAMVGDPSGKTDMRKMLTKEQIQHNVDSIKKQMERFIDFSDDKALIVNNADWLLDLNYVDFLREVGVHFSVNRMLSAECFKQRLEKGLSFLEFNYMLMQGYDFYVLNQKYGCKMELGGDDQWSNMIAGVELVRRKAQGDAMAMTCTLLTNSQGQKMGKTVGGALWLDADKVSPFDFYQYWRNVDDADVEKCLALLTFLPMDEVRRLGALEGAEINGAKKILAYEVTKLVHGDEEAKKAEEAANALFSGGADMSNVPTVIISKEDLGSTVLDVIAKVKIVPSKKEGRRLIEQGGLSINGEKITELTRTLNDDDFKDGSALIKRGKKNYNKIEIQ
ncbi:MULTISPECIES: tyrosine--tRNA ligase [unclassified Clostridium]|uniref:Tyrosine--tRNA ligase n=1 Tax=Clostridium botulinum (strain Eklund 17B / Type B) TaxID=935198 RepID=SYY_CLOBB|nr:MULTISPECIES: tyrosine--tRNA ligase [unclassified Clostridium]B2TQ95.1 RecName: Full=Tyrosine--tRNA ligase; AltName: Full=Tyrosyl-tRNA synthetase; Short=TyrRS [Clostridium botulinum B str. Eklund 17B (NRP)]MBY6975534.1 tyrosine--tRNA ligase [Clostridium botulinum]ACD23219.1 tyrosine--tRNA ligase [Clostridium botulinum B str. Eklund 17B (NRP)]MBY7001083.1 tyrosine--tRNA ligase [Clostridium botulinum]MCR1273850.1 tyrosine--tRNA ligase [Clostridium botulinum]NFD69386.1 tyrosine--tRNA ligase [